MRQVILQICLFIFVSGFLGYRFPLLAQEQTPDFRVIGFFTAQNDLRKNPDIQILLSIDSSSFPLGTGPKPHEIWHSGDYPVVWTHTHYRMMYFNMGHNDIDYENGTNQELSFTFNNKLQDRLILDSLLWLGIGKNKPAQP